VSIENEENAFDGQEEDDEKIGQAIKEFETFYHDECNALKHFGYQCIKDEESNENVDEVLNINEYYFTEDGKRED
jgi:hypothetical protein